MEMYSTALKCAEVCVTALLTRLIKLLNVRFICQLVVASSN